MKDLAINLGFSDPAYDSGGVLVDSTLPIKNDLTLTDYDLVLVDEIEALRQLLQIKLQFFLGEWYLDTSKGVPFYTDILLPNPELNKIQAIIKAAISESEGVKDFLVFDATFDRAARRLNVSFTVDTIYGEISVTGEIP